MRDKKQLFARILALVLVGAMLLPALAYVL